MSDFGSRINIEEAGRLCGRLVEMVAADARGGFKSAADGEVTLLLEAEILKTASQAKDCMVFDAREKEVFVALVVCGVESLKAENAARKSAPSYIKKTRELWWHGGQIRHWERESGRQQVVILAFEAAGWRESIENPFANENELDPGGVLWQTIKDLNRHLEPDTIHFRRSGDGGILWEEVKKEK